MPKIVKELSALEVGRIKHVGFHAVGGVPGLLLQVTPTGSRSWVLRTMVAGKRRSMGLGGFPGVTLAMAKEKARAARDLVDEGVDPIARRVAARSALRATAAAAKTFAQCAREYVESKSAEWRNDKHRKQWSATLETYANPHIGDLLVSDIDRAQVMNVLQPIWTTKTETASRVRGRMESVLDWATVSGYRKGDNPARWRGHLEKLLPKPSKVAAVEHHAALDLDAVPGFISRLREQPGQGARALEFAILTAARSGEVRGATWDEIDLEAGEWVIPGKRMKAGREHRVPLSKPALKLLRAQPRIDTVPYVFPNTKGTQLSDMTLSSVMRRMKVDAVPHGFRSTFRDWAAERTAYPAEMAEMALAHTIENKVEAAYRRGDLFERRRKMMADWASFIGSPKASGKIVALRA